MSALPPLPPLLDEPASTVKRGRGNPAWTKGVSGNPGGRFRKLPELTAAICEVSAELTQRLVQLARGLHKARPQDQIAAIKLLFAYAYGNPVQAITGPDGEALKLGIVVLPPEDAC